MNVVKSRGEGYYSWRARLLSDDICSTDRSDRSAWSSESLITAGQIADFHRPNEFVNFRQLKEYCRAAYSSSNSIRYTGSSPFDFTEDLTIPENLFVWFPQTNVIVVSGTKLRIDGNLMLSLSSMNVSGTLVNNGATGLHGSAGSGLPQRYTNRLLSGS